MFSRRILVRVLAPAGDRLCQVGANGCHGGPGATVQSNSKSKKVDSKNKPDKIGTDVVVVVAPYRRKSEPTHSDGAWPRTNDTRPAQSQAPRVKPTRAKSQGHREGQNAKSQETTRQPFSTPETNAPLCHALACDSGSPTHHCVTHAKAA